MHLLKLSVAKDTTIPRQDMTNLLPAYEVCSLETASKAMPAERSKTDAVRAAASYALLSYKRFEHNGRTCEVLSKSPKSDSKRGMTLQINIREIGESKISYSEEILTLSAPDAHSTPEMLLSPIAVDFERLVAALNVDTLIDRGQSTLYDNDIRKIIELLLERYTVSLWKGLSLVLDDDGLKYIKRLQRLCDSELTHGSVTLSTLALDMSQANRTALARELGEEFCALLAKLLERAGYPAPSVKAINAEYELLSAKIDQAELLLGCEIPCTHARIDLETALMALE